MIAILVYPEGMLWRTADLTWEKAEEIAGSWRKAGTRCCVVDVPGPDEVDLDDVDEEEAEPIELADDEKPILEELQALIDEARAKRMMILHSSKTYGHIWFTPDHLKRKNKQGHFVWGKRHWCLRSIQEYLNEGGLHCHIAEVQYRKKVAAKYVAQLEAAKE
jgi:hypothetical protein